MMKKILPITMLMGLLTAGCGKSNKFILEGEIEGLPSDTMRVEYQLPEPRLDTLVASKGKFKYVLTPDTATMFTLVAGPELRIPVFAEPGMKLKVMGKGNALAEKAEGLNASLAEVRKQLATVDPKAVKDSVDAFIRQTPDSYINLYLIDTYYAHDSVPQIPRMKALIDGMSGVLKDTPYLTALSSQLEAMEKANSTHYLNLVSYTDRNGKRVNVSDLRDQYLCVHFWSSWDAAQNRATEDSLRSMLKQLKKEKFKVVSISLDMDKKAWLRACPKDTASWIQLCSFKGWEDEAAKNVGIQKLPTTLLLGTDRRIVGRDLTSDETVKKVKELIEEKKKVEAEKKKREAELKAKKK